MSAIQIVALSAGGFSLPPHSYPRPRWLRWPSGRSLRWCSRTQSRTCPVQYIIHMHGCVSDQVFAKRTVTSVLAMGSLPRRECITIGQSWYSDSDPPVEPPALDRAPCSDRERATSGGDRGESLELGNSKLSACTTWSALAVSPDELALPSPAEQHEALLSSYMVCACNHSRGGGPTLGAGIGQQAAATWRG